MRASSAYFSGIYSTSKSTSKMTRPVRRFISGLCLLLLASGLTHGAWAADAKVDTSDAPKGTADQPDLNFDSYPDKTDVPKPIKHAKKKKVAKPQVEETVVPTQPPGFTDIAPPAPASDAASLQAALPEDKTHLGIPEVEVGISFQAYQPAGQITLSGMQPYDISVVGAQPMVALDFSWMPWQFDTSQPIALGIFASMGYARASENLTSATGTTISGTELQSLKAQAGATFAWQPNLASIYRLRLQLGGGQWNETQTSDADYANHSAYEYFGSAGLFGDVHFLPRAAPQVAAYIGFDYRAPLGAEPPEIVLQRNNFVAGLAGTFQ